MATIYKEILIDAAPDDVWSAVRDVGAVHRRLAPGFVTDVRLEGDARIVTFANGMVVREVLLGIDEAHRRFAYAATGGRSGHHSASFQVLAEGPARTRLVWITDMLPEEMAGAVREMVEQGSAVIKRTLERQAATA